MNAEKIKFRTPSPATSYAGATEPEEGSASETDNSIASSPSTLKKRLHNLPSSNEAVKLADRVAALNRRIRRERDLYLHLQGATNRIEETDEMDLNTTDSSRTMNSNSNRNRPCQSSNPRARRRERLNSVLTMPSDSQLCSPGFSSPEPSTMREVRKDFIEKMGQHSFEKDPVVDIMENNTGPSNSFNNPQSQFSNDNFSSESNDREDPNGVVDAEFQNHERNSSTDFHDVNFSGAGENTESLAVNSSNASFDCLDFTYMCQKRRTPTNFGGYRPVQGLIFRNLSSDSESDVPLEGTALRTFDSRNLRREESADLDIQDLEEEELQESEPEQYFDAKIKISRERRLSPIPSVDSKLVFEDSKLSETVDSDLKLRNPLEPKEDSEDAYISGLKTGSGISENSNHQTSTRSSNKLRNLDENTGSDNSVFNQQNDDNLADEKLCPRIPILEIASHGYSQSQSLSSEDKNETTRSSLDVNALIQALSDVSLKRGDSSKRRNRSALKLKSPLGYGNRFSESSGPRSSEYTPAAGGSRQSLTSLEVSETQSLKISNDNSESIVRRQTTPLRRSIDLSVRSTSRTPDKMNLDMDQSEGSSFIPVVAKVNRTNLVCPKHPLKIKSIEKLLSPRKYPNADFAEGMNKPLQTSRTDVSQSSDGSRKSFRSFRSVEMVEKMRETNNDGLKRKTDRTNLPVPISGRRILEPLNAAPKLQPELLTSLNRKFERRKKIAKNLSDVINSGINDERVSTADSRLSSDTRTKFSTLRQVQVLSGRKTPREQFNGSSRASTNEDENSVGNSIEGEKYSRIASEKSSVISDKALCLLSEKLSISSSDYGGRISSSPSPRDEGSVRNDDDYDSEYKPANDLRNIQLKKFSTNSVPRPFGNFVHLDDLQDGREVTLPCGKLQCHEEGLQGKVLFERLPDEISASLTRNVSFDNQVAKNLNSSIETPSTFEDLRKNLQINNDQWMKDFGRDDYLRKMMLKSADNKLISSTDSQSQNLIQNSTTIPEKVLPMKNVETEESSCSRSCPSSQVDPKSSECSSPPYEHIRQGSVHINSESCEMDSQRTSVIDSTSNSRQNTHRSICESTDFANVLKYDDRSFEKEEATNFSGEHLQLSDQEIVSIPERYTKVRRDGVREPFTGSSNDSSAEVDYREDQGILNAYDQEATPFKIAKIDNGGTDTIPYFQLNYSQPKEGNKINQFADELKIHESSDRDSEEPIKCDEVRENKSLPSSTRSAKSEGVTQNHQDATLLSPVSVKSFLSMSKLKTCTESKRDLIITLPAGGSGVKKSQDRFPFTISESASRKTSKYKVATDMSLEQLIQNQNSHAEHNDSILSKKTENQGIEYGMKTCEEIPARQFTHHSIELTNKVSNDSPNNLEVEGPIFVTNYISYGFREEPRNLIPTMKKMVRKFSAKLRNTKMKRRHDELQSDEASVEILYRNKKCRCDSTEGSSSIVSLYESQILDTSSKLLSDSIGRSDNDSRVSSRETVKPKRNLGCTTLSMQKQSPKKGCDRNDLWIQEFDSDVELDEQTSTDTYCKMMDEKRTETMPCTSSPIKDRYSMFLVRRKLSEIIDKVDLEEEIKIHPVLDWNREGEVDCESQENIRVSFNEEQQVVSKFPKTPENSSCNEFESAANRDSLKDSPVKTGCCCFRIYRSFTKCRKRSSKTGEQIKVSE